MLIKGDAQSIREVLVDDCRISLEEFVAVARYHAKVRFSDAYCQRVRNSRRILEERISDGVGIYGVNTGFGDNVRYRISENDMVRLQENIIRSHGCSVGRLLDEEEVRAMLLLLITNIGKGYSATRFEIVEQARLFLNEGIYPYVPAEGTVGQLTCQPYMAITLFGEGRIIDNGEVRPAAEVLAEHNIPPIQISFREGLASLTNASGSVGTAMLAIYDYVMAVRHGDLCAALVCEALQSTDKHFDPRLMAGKGHKEQIASAEYLLKLLKNSEIVADARKSHIQDSSSIRIIPHVQGVAKRVGEQAYQAIMEEFYAVFDNPIFLPDGTALMGSNWDATMIETYCDSLCLGVMNLAKLFEVHMERMVTPTLSGLPAFLVKNPGLNNGFMLVQYSTLGLLGDILLLTNPAGAFNGAVSAGQESPLYRDETAARKLRTAVSKLEHLISLTMMTALQALGFRTRAMSPITQKLYDEARRTVTFMENDDLMYERIEAMEQLVKSNRLLQLAQELAGDFVF